MQRLKPGKQPAEVFWITADFTAELDTAESVVLAGSSVAEASLTNITGTENIIVAGSFMVGNGAKSLMVKLAGGVARDSRKISFRAMTSDDNLYELDVEIPIFD